MALSSAKDNKCKMLREWRGQGQRQTFFVFADPTQHCGAESSERFTEAAWTTRLPARDCGSQVNQLAPSQHHEGD
eukprot:scaffold269855_cov22-Tisochrysis_lutea.AAC.4